MSYETTEEVLNATKARMRANGRVYKGAGSNAGLTWLAAQIRSYMDVPDVKAYDYTTLHKVVNGKNTSAPVIGALRRWLIATDTPAAPVAAAAAAGAGADVPATSSVEPTKQAGDASADWASAQPATWEPSKRVWATLPLPPQPVDSSEHSDSEAGHADVPPDCPGVTLATLCPEGFDTEMLRLVCNLGRQHTISVSTAVVDLMNKLEQERGKRAPQPGCIYMLAEEVLPRSEEGPMFRGRRHTGMFKCGAVEGGADQVWPTGTTRFNARSLTQVLSIEVSDVYAIESMVHARLGPWHINREWFRHVDLESMAAKITLWCTLARMASLVLSGKVSRATMLTLLAAHCPGGA